MKTMAHFKISFHIFIWYTSAKPATSTNVYKSNL